MVGLSRRKERFLRIGSIDLWLLLLMVVQLLTSLSSSSSSSPTRIRLFCTAFGHQIRPARTHRYGPVGNQLASRIEIVSYQQPEPLHRSLHRRQRYQTTMANSFARLESNEEKIIPGNGDSNINISGNGNTIHSSIKSTPPSTLIRAKIVPPTELEQCGERLRQGELVAFPTETVYGLGCNALDRNAIIKVFEAKERPLTDPLITHVTQNRVAYELWDAAIREDAAIQEDDSSSSSSSSLEGRALQALCERFWPGPLTLVARAAPHVPSILMAGTGFVACRSPQHPTAIALIDAARVPIAAPSANKFGHVSPTRSHHVWDDLKYEDVWIVRESSDNGGGDDDDNNESNVCHVGVESSVAKIEMISIDGDTSAAGFKKRGQITLLRQGAVSVQEIQGCLESAGLADDFVVIRRTKKATDETVAHVAPGQTIRHYSPHIPSFILSTQAQSVKASVKSSSLHFAVHEKEKDVLSKTVVIDFGGKLKAYECFSLAYKDLSVTGDSAEATNRVFETLRWAELVDGAAQIVFPDIVENDDQHDTVPNGLSLDALTLALKDRLTRAASGVVIDSLGAEMDET